MHTIPSLYFLVYFCLLIIILIFCSSFLLIVFAESPSFVRQEIPDDLNDFKTVAPSTPVGYRDANPDCEEKSIASSDIKSISYISNGKFLNATIWLNSPYNSDIPWEKLVYGMYLDVDSVYEAGIDYIYNIYLNSQNKTWNQEFVELSVPAAKFTNIKSDLGNFSGKTYIDFSLDLKALNYPSQYKIFFASGANFINYNNTSCKLVDTTNFVSIPPPEFNINSSPNILELRPGEEKYIQLKIQSKTNLDSDITLSSIQLDKLKIKFTTDQINVPPFSTAISNVRVYALPNAQPGSFSIPISTDINFPKTTNVILGGKVSFENIITPILSKESYYTITILPKLTFSEYLNLVVNSWITPISGLWSFLAGVAAVIAPLIIRLYRKRDTITVTEKSDSKTKV
jgi:hypothetical protein